MELNDKSFIEELMALRGDTTYPIEMNERLFCTEMNAECAQDFPSLVPSELNFDCLSEVYYSFSAGLSSVAPELKCPDVNNNKIESIPLLVQERRPDSDEELVFLNCEKSCEVEEINTEVSVHQKKMKYKKVDGAPSKNLMAERRRRKRLNDRLSMLRSIVPKISKMDRTSILGDTIDYMKELLESIKILKEEIDVDDEKNVLSILKDVDLNEMQTRIPPKFKVERKNTDTRIEINCGSKPGLLLSMLSAMDSMGIDIQQCVVSCFNDFRLQASCSEEKGQKEVLNTEEIEQTLFRVAGHGSRYL